MGCENGVVDGSCLSSCELLGRCSIGHRCESGDDSQSRRDTGDEMHVEMAKGLSSLLLLSVKRRTVALCEPADASYEAIYVAHVLRKDRWMDVL